MSKPLSIHGAAVQSKYASFAACDRGIAVNKTVDGVAAGWTLMFEHADPVPVLKSWVAALRMGGHLISPGDYG